MSVVRDHGTLALPRPGVVTGRGRVTESWLLRAPAILSGYPPSVPIGPGVSQANCDEMNEMFWHAEASAGVRVGL